MLYTLYLRVHTGGILIQDSPLLSQVHRHLVEQMIENLRSGFQMQRTGLDIASLDEYEEGCCSFLRRSDDSIISLSTYRHG